MIGQNCSPLIEESLPDHPQRFFSMDVVHAEDAEHFTLVVDIDAKIIAFLGGSFDFHKNDTSAYGQFPHYLVARKQREDVG